VASLEDITYVVRQNYALMGDDGAMYGQNNQDCFGFRYGGAIIWNGQLYMSPTTYYAHLLDSTTQAYGKEYTPVPSKIFFKHLQAPSFTLIDSGSIKATPGKAVVAMPDSLSGYSPENINEHSSKRVILMTMECKDRELNDSSQYKLSFLYTDILVEPNGVSHLPSNKIGNSAHFALVFEEITEVGVTRLEFLGFAETVGDKAIVKMVKIEPTPTPQQEENNGLFRRR